MNGWICRQPGWLPGDRWGPGPNDIVPDVPLCLPDTTTLQHGLDWLWIFLIALLVMLVLIALRARGEAHDD